MGDKKLIYVLLIFLIISLIILPTIIGGKDKGKDLPTNIEDIDDPIIIPRELYKETTDFLNMRTGPGTGFDIIITIEPAERVEVIGEENGWDKVVYKGNTGYCSQEYLTEISQ